MSAVEQKIWHQVADAGFGAAVEASGFRRVGRTMWRRDSDRVVWRVCLARGFASSPKSFRGSYGGGVQEIDDLVKLFHPKRRLENMPGTSTPWHLGRGLENDSTEAERKAYREFWNARMTRPTGWRGVWKDLVNPLPPMPAFPQSRIPFFTDRAMGSASHHAAFEVSEEWSVAAVSDVLIRQWQVQALPWFDSRSDLERIYAKRWGPEANTEGGHYWFDAEYYAAAKLMGDQAWIDTMAEMAFAKGRVTYDEIWKQLKKEGVFKRPRVVSGETSPEKIAMNAYESRLIPGATVLAIAEAMHIAVPEHGIDFEAFGRPVAIYRN